MAGPFPNELLIEIFANLTRAECKIARLVSSSWSTLAAGFVFSSVRVDPWDGSLKTFTAIAEHPVLSEKVINLSFSARLVEQNINRNEYLQLLLRQIRLELQLYGEPLLVNDLDSDSGRVVRHATEPLPFHARGLVDEENRLCLLPVVGKGYDSYVKRAEQQKSWLHGTRFWETLARGLQRLRGIRCIEFEDSSIACRPAGHNDSSFCFMSPFKMASPFLSTTYSMNLQPGSRTHDSYSSQLSNLFRALQQSQIAVRSLFLCIDASTQILNPRNQMENDLSPLLEDIQEFSLGLGLYRDEDGFPAFLRTVSSMRNLKRLELYPSRFYEFNEMSYWSLQNLIGSSTPVWQNLCEFRLFGAAANAADLLDLLQKQPALRRITLGAVNLTWGNWEATIDSLRRSLVLTQARLQKPLTESHSSRASGAVEDATSSNTIEEYVLREGQNPLENNDEYNSVSL